MVSKMDISNKASYIRKLLGEDNYSPIDIFALVQSIEKLTLVFYPLGNTISGACIRNGTSVVIAINSGMSVGRQRFSLSHELYHLYYDNDLPSIICQSKIGNGSENEKTADRFASYLLMPQIALYERILQLKDGPKKRKLTMAEIIGLEQHFGVSRQAMLFRLQEENELNQNDVEDMQKNVIKSAARLGYNISLYKPTRENRNKETLGYYVKQAEYLLNSNAISTGKYEEWLMDAFRDDIVYGDESEADENVD